MQFRLYPTKPLKIERAPGEKLSLRVPRSSVDMFRLMGEFHHTRMQGQGVTVLPSKYQVEYGSYRTLFDAVNAYFDIMGPCAKQLAPSYSPSDPPDGVDIFITNNNR